MDACLACDVNEGRIEPPGGPIYIDELWQADHELTPLARGYVILKPRRHVHEIADLSESEAAALGPTLSRLHSAMRAALGTERIYTCSFAETVLHLHFHIVPRYQWMPGLGPDLLPRLFGGEWRCTEAEAADAADQIRSRITPTTET
ncbi:MAG TPA: HIT family protein [Candidatus Limnocylindrales bacterium]